MVVDFNVTATSKVYFRDGSAEKKKKKNCTCCHTEIDVFNIKLHISPSYSILTSGQAVQALTLYTPNF